MKLGTLLLRNAAIGLTQLEAALRNQVLYGGRLGTNLVELGFIDLELLSAYLAELSGYPIATPTLLDDIDRTLLDRLGADDAHRLRAIPLGTIGDASTIAVALVDPTDTAALEEVARKLDATITPYVVPELRALYYLEKHFGLPRRARFVRSGTVDGEPGAATSAGSPTPPATPAGLERRRAMPAHGMVMPPAFTLEPRRRRISQLPIASAPPAIALAYSSACERIEGATDREQIGDALVEYAAGRLDALVVFLVRDGNALGWRGYSTHVAKPDFAELSLPLGGASSLQSAHDTGQPFYGVPPSAARPVETQLWNALGVISEPSVVVVIPVIVKQRTVNLIYAHTVLTAPSPQVIGELAELASRAQISYLRLLRQARGS